MHPGVGRFHWSSAHCRRYFNMKCEKSQLEMHRLTCDPTVTSRPPLMAGSDVPSSMALVVDHWSCFFGSRWWRTLRLWKSLLWFISIIERHSVGHFVLIVVKPVESVELIESHVHFPALPHRNFDSATHGTASNLHNRRLICIIWPNSVSVSRLMARHRPNWWS